MNNKNCKRGSSSSFKVFLHRISLLQVISPSFCLENILFFVPIPRPALCVLGTMYELAMRGDGSITVDASDAARLGRRLGVIPSLGASSPTRPFRVGAGFSTGASDGIISRASCRTSTALSCLLSFSTISYIPYFSTSAVRLGWTSQIVFRRRKRFSLTTALLCPRRSIKRWKNCDLAMPRVTVFDIRQILRKGSKRFSNELVFAATKHFTRASSEDSLTSTSSTLAVSS